MYLRKGITAQLVLKDGTTVVGVAARSRQWGVHKLVKVRVLTRDDEGAKLSGHLLIPRRSVWFAQIMPPELEE